jgi:hypothetical protein
MRKKGKGGKWKTQSDVILASSGSRIPPLSLFAVFHFPSSYTSLQMAQHLRRKESGMLRGLVSVLLVGAFVLGSGWFTTATAGQPLGLWRTHPFKPGQGAFWQGRPAAPSGAWFYPEPIPELEPWRSDRVGVPSYNWGYFGARTRPSCSQHQSYHGEYIQWTSRRGP